MTPMTPMRLGARLQQVLGAADQALTAGLAAQDLMARGRCAAERRALLALRIAIARMAPPAAAAAIPAPEPAPPGDALQAMPDPVTEPVAELPPAAPKPRKPARVTMSSVRLEDAALLLGSAFADEPEQDKPAAPDQG